MFFENFLFLFFKGIEKAKDVGERLAEGDKQFWRKQNVLFALGKFTIYIVEITVKLREVNNTNSETFSVFLCKNE